MTGTIGGRWFAKRMATSEAVFRSGRPGWRKSGCSRSRCPAIDGAYRRCRRCRRKKVPAPSSRAAWTKLKRDNGMLRRSLNRQTSGGTFSFRTILSWKRRRSTECFGQSGPAATITGGLEPGCWGWPEARGTAYAHARDARVPPYERGDSRPRCPRAAVATERLTPAMPACRRSHRKALHAIAFRGAALGTVAVLQARGPVFGNGTGVSGESSGLP